MRVLHKTLRHSVERKFFTLDHITEVTQLTRSISLNGPGNSKMISEFLAEEFYNLKAVPVKLLMKGNSFETTHWVNVTKDGQYILDTTGDRFDFTSFLRYRSHVTPWIYKKAKTSDFYFSSNHLPSSPPEGLGKHYTDVDVMMLSKNPFSRPIRCIIL